MSENDVLAVAVAAFLTWKITARSFAYQQAKRTAEKNAEKKASQ